VPCATCHRKNCAICVWLHLSKISMRRCDIFQSASTEDVTFGSAAPTPIRARPMNAPIVQRFRKRETAAFRNARRKNSV
jgi:hypothetical protein